jgi:hypothetical protein
MSDESAVAGQGFASATTRGEAVRGQPQVMAAAVTLIAPGSPHDLAHSWHDGVDSPRGAVEHQNGHSERVSPVGWELPVRSLLIRTPTLLGVLFKGGWTIAWRRFHARRPVVAELAQWTPILAFWWFIAFGGPLSLWLPVVLTALLLVRIWWDYRPNGRGTRLREANRTNPRRGFEWATSDPADERPG